MATILELVVRAIEYSNVRPGHQIDEITSFVVEANTAQQVAENAAALLPVEVLKPQGNRFYLEDGQALIRDFRIEKRSAYVTLIIGPADSSPPPNRNPSCGITETVLLKKKLTGQWFITERHQIMC